MPPVDTITQAALGAAIGQAGFRDLGRRGSAFGAACGLLPDLDSVLGIGDPWLGLVTHRGLSHSLIVLPVVALPLGWVAWRFLGQRSAPRRWIHLAFWALVTHPLLDFFTTYGTQLFAPLTRARFSLDAVAIIDPFYSLPLLIALIYGLRARAIPRRAVRLARVALVWGCIYLAGQSLFTQANQSVFERRLVELSFVPIALRTPAPLLFPMLRHGVARDQRGRIAVTTLWLGTHHPSAIKIIEPYQDSRSEAALRSERGEIWRWFTDGMVSTVQLDTGELVFSDHRYGSYSDPTQSGFRAVLEQGQPPGELRFFRPGQGNQKINPRHEIEAALGILRGDRATETTPMR